LKCLKKIGGSDHTHVSYVREKEHVFPAAIRIQILKGTWCKRGKNEKGHWKTKVLVSIWAALVMGCIVLPPNSHVGVLDTGYLRM